MNSINFIMNNNDSDIFFVLLNKGHNSVLINNSFSLSSSGKRGNVELLFINEKGVEYVFSAKIKYKRIKEEDVIYLHPGSVVGGSLKMEGAKSYYRLPSGEYEVTGFYKNYYGEEYGAFIGESNVSKISVHIK